jgi:hypothetical protein
LGERNNLSLLQLKSWDSRAVESFKVGGWESRAWRAQRPYQDGREGAQEEVDAGDVKK